MESFHKKWQSQWRQIMSKPLDPETPFNEDFEIHFKLWNLNDDKFRECFSVFPYGIELANRALELKSGAKNKYSSEKVSDKILMTLTNSLIKRVSNFIDFEDVNLSDVKILRGNDDERIIVFSDADFLTFELDDNLDEIILDNCGEEALYAYLFLSEPLYRFSSSYEPGNWVIWAMLKKQNLLVEDPYEAALELWRHNAQVGINDEGIFIFVEE